MMNARAKTLPARFSSLGETSRPDLDTARLDHIIEGAECSPFLPIGGPELPITQGIIA